MWAVAFIGHRPRLRGCAAVWGEGSVFLMNSWSQQRTTRATLSCVCNRKKDPAGQLFVEENEIEKGQGTVSRESRIVGIYREREIYLCILFGFLLCGHREGTNRFILGAAMMCTKRGADAGETHTSWHRLTGRLAEWIRVYTHVCMCPVLRATSCS